MAVHNEAGAAAGQMVGDATHVARNRAEDDPSEALAPNPAQEGAHHRTGCYAEGHDCEAEGLGQRPHDRKGPVGEQE